MKLWPMTVEQMVTAAAGTFLNGITTDVDLARHRAAQAIQKLIDERYVDWWGMTEDHQPLYVPSSERVGRNT